MRHWGKVLTFFRVQNMRPNLKWGFVGIVTVTLDFSLFLILYGLTSQIVFSNLIAGAFATSINFRLHRYWTFQSDSSTRILLIRYLCLVMLLFAIGTTSTYVLINVGISAHLSKSVSIGLNILLSRLGTFKVFGSDQ